MKKPVIIAALLVLLVALGCGIWAANGGTGLPMPGGISQDEDPDGDCDAGDLRESKPDPDCNGLWLGTPTPGANRTPSARKTTAPAATKGSNPKPVVTGTRRK
jgi:hypothetical protein